MIWKQTATNNIVQETHTNTGDLADKGLRKPWPARLNIPFFKLDPSLETKGLALCRVFKVLGAKLFQWNIYCVPSGHEVVVIQDLLKQKVSISLLSL